MTISDSLKYKPVVAFDVDGVIRISPWEGFTQELISIELTFEQEEYPQLFHGKPRWDEQGRATGVNYFAPTAIDFLRKLTAENHVTPVWATTWQRWANYYFAKAFNLPELPVAVETLEPPELNWFHCSPSWKTYQLAKLYPGRPLIWLDDNMPDRPGEELEELRNVNDRALTLSYRVDPWNGITPDDVEAIEAWLLLASSPEGHKQLRAERNKKLATKRRARQRWQAKRDREDSIGDQVRSKVEELYPGQDYFARDLGSLARLKDGLTDENLSYAVKRHSMRVSPQELGRLIRVEGYHHS